MTVSGKSNPSLPAAPEISVIIPAFNEQNRLGSTIESIASYFAGKQVQVELIVVDDGSSDRTAELVADYSRKLPIVRLLTYPHNRGKGHAVKFGMTNARGRLRLFDDADGSTPIEEIERLTSAIDGGADVAIGSRAMRSSDTAVRALWYRKLIGRTFNLIVNTLIVPNIADTQCGFKMFTAEAADRIFPLQRSERFSFDVELLFLARKNGFKIAEVPVNWHNVPGSKVNLAVDSLAMLKDIFVFRLNYLLGRYTKR